MVCLSNVDDLLMLHSIHTQQEHVGRDSLVGGRSPTAHSFESGLTVKICPSAI